MRQSRQTLLAFVALLTSLLLPITVTAQDQASDSAFAGIMQHYEAIRLALLSDSLDGLSDHGHEIHGIVEGLNGNWSAQRAGVRAEKTDEAKALLPALSAAATQLAESEDLEAARTALYALSKPLVRYRKMVGGELPAVAYCPMAKRSWLQPKGEIGNPYYGQSMPTCGEVVDG
jgi:hypothetical protein